MTSLDADPKSVLCVFFKQGQCMKGDKCKFSHDLSLERKAEKKNLYIDSRDVTLENGKYSVQSINCCPKHCGKLPYMEAQACE